MNNKITILFTLLKKIFKIFNIICNLLFLQNNMLETDNIKHIIKNKSKNILKEKFNNIEIKISKDDINV